MSMPVRRGSAVLAALVFAVCALGACGGSDDAGGDVGVTSSVAEAASATTEEEEGAEAPEDEAVMPDLQGMTEDEAEDELAGLGVDGAELVVEEQEYVEAAGTVIGQVPQAGSKIRGTITIVIAIEVSEVPEFVGQQISDVREWADERGIEVVEEEVLRDDPPSGTVIATTPAAGSRATTQIVVEVATEPVIRRLAEEDPISRDDCRFERGVEGSVNGTPIEKSILAASYNSSGDQCVIEYDLGRDWQRLVATVGISDDSTTDTRFRLQIYGDDQELSNEVIGFGQEYPVDVDVTDVLRLKITITTIDDSFGGGTHDVVLGNLRLVGSPAAVPDTTTTTVP